MDPLGAERDLIAALLAEVYPSDPPSISPSEKPWEQPASISPQDLLLNAPKQYKSVWTSDPGDKEPLEMPASHYASVWNCQDRPHQPCIETAFEEGYTMRPCDASVLGAPWDSDGSMNTQWFEQSGVGHEEMRLTPVSQSALVKAMSEVLYRDVERASPAPAMECEPLQDVCTWRPTRERLDLYTPRLIAGTGYERRGLCPHWCVRIALAILTPASRKARCAGTILAGAVRAANGEAHHSVHSAPPVRARRLLGDAPPICAAAACKR